MTIQVLLRLFSMLLLAAGVQSAALAADVDPARLLQLSDQARGGGLPGLVWEVKATNSGSQANEEEGMRLLIKAIDNASLAETLEPLRSKGGRMLQVERNMWLTKPGLKKPVPISPRQRLTGQAAIGDIAATNYVRDYTPRLLREEAQGGEPCVVLELVAKRQQATYDRLLYWVSQARGVGVRAEFFSLSGKRLKTAQFEYGNKIQVQGKSIAFISRMSIADELTDARTVLEYSQVRVKALAPAEFDVGHLE